MKSKDYTIEQKIDYHQKMVKELIAELDYRTSRIEQLHKQQIEIEISKYLKNKRALKKRA